jgi:hypothetical protein
VCSGRPAGCCLRSGHLRESIPGVSFLKLFRAWIAPGAVAATVRIWLPRNPEMGGDASIAPGVDIYNVDWHRFVVAVMILGK